MITTDAVGSRIELHAFGRLTIADLRSFEITCESHRRHRRGHSRLDLLLDLRNMEGQSLDAIIEEWKYAHAHAEDFRRIAVVSDDQLVSWGACLSQLFMNAEFGAFDNLEAADTWLSQGQRSPRRKSADTATTA